MDDKQSYAAEAKERWGDTEAYKQSRERVKEMTKEEMDKIKQAGDELMKKIAAQINNDPAGKDVQALIGEHYNALRKFYEPSLEMYAGLADMYISDPRFTAYFEKYAVGLAKFMHEAMKYYVQHNQ
jgi:hypothetical protein